MMSWAARTDSLAPRWLRNRAGASVPGQSRRSWSQRFRACASFGWIGTSRTRSPLPKIRSAPLRAESRTSVDVEGDEFADAGAGVEGDEGDGLVPGRRAAVHGAQATDLGPVLQGPGRGVGQVDAKSPGRPEAALDVEVVDGGQGAVDGRWRSLEHSLEMAAVVSRTAQSRPVTVPSGSQSVSAAASEAGIGGLSRRRSAGSAPTAGRSPTRRRRRPAQLPRDRSAPPPARPRRRLARNRRIL